MTKPMSNRRLADLDQRITNSCNTYDCNCDNAPCGLEPREARELLAEVKRLRELAVDTEWGLVPDHADPDQSRSVGTGEYGRQEAYLNQQMYHHVTQRPIGKWRVVKS